MSGPHAPEKAFLSLESSYMQQVEDDKLELRLEDKGPPKKNSVSTNTL